MAKKISIVTPWKGHSELIPDYEAAVQGAEVITVDNSVQEGDSVELLKMTERLNGIYIRNSMPASFSRSNNQGLREASGEIILFLNNDIHAEAGLLDSIDEEIDEHALYGPSLQYQTVYGLAIPYIEGWCIAASRKIWQSLDGWDEKAFKDFYWEDNDLSFRASQNGYELKQTAWKITHKGGATIKSPHLYGTSYERNRAIFASRVKRCIGGIQSTPAQDRLLRLLTTPTDIQAHLPLLFTLSKGNVLELGVRSGTSTCALVAGVEVHKGKVWSVDIDSRCSEVFKGHPLWNFFCTNSTDPALLGQLPREFNLLLLDTEHDYDQVYSELNMWAPHVKPGGVICVHDTESFPEVKHAISSYCIKAKLEPVFLSKSNGMAIIEIPINPGGITGSLIDRNATLNSAIKYLNATEYLEEKGQEESKVQSISSSLKGQSTT